MLSFLSKERWGTPVHLVFTRRVSCYHVRNGTDLGIGGEMKYGNVLVIGKSGVGKSTLINAVLGEDTAEVGGGISGTTKEMEIYQSDAIPFRVIDTVGFEPNFFKRRKAINEVKRWSKRSADAKGKEDTEGADAPDRNEINVIWFCVDGTSRKLFPETIRDLSRATKMWESVPVIVVITKSYSMPERKENIQLVYNAFASQKNISKNLKKVIPVVAETYALNDTAFAAPDGLTELIDATNDLLPEGIKAARKDIARFKLKRKQAYAHSVVAASAAAGVAIGAVPVPIPDAAILVPLETMEINAIASIYGVKKNEDSRKLLETLIAAGAAGIAAKAAINAVKAVPGINLAAAAVNGCVAGCVVAALGESARYVFEKIYLGEKSILDIDWVNQVIESSFAAEFTGKVAAILQELTTKDGTKDIGDLVSQMADVFSPGKDKTLGE